MHLRRLLVAVAGVAGMASATLVARVRRRSQAANWSVRRIPSIARMRPSSPQTGPVLEVALTHPRFRLTEIGRGNRLTGRVAGTE